jgi:HD superfamily phosphodiesterase
MKTSDAVWKEARGDLVIAAVAGGKPEISVWERAERVGHLALQIASFPELARERIDREALLAAALYHDAGWIVQLRRGEIARSALRARPTTDAHRDLAAMLLEESLRDVLPHVSLAIAAGAVRESGRKSPRGIEARIVGEAAHLDDFGPQAICQIVVRQINDGGGMSGVLHAWDRQCEYHFWQARINDGLQYESSRVLARRRLAIVESFMSELRRCQLAEDAAEMAAELPPAADPAPR